MQQFQRTKWACYTGNLGMAIVSNFPPLLFLTFRSVYGISYSLLGFLVLANFCTQLAVDFIFSFFSHRFNIPRMVKLTPVLAVVGLLLFAFLPFVFPGQIYLCFVLGTMIFSAASGFAEVLISPVIAAIPAENPDREMSKLHSIYAWGVVGVITVGTLFLLAFGKENWHWLMTLMALIPALSAVLYCGTEIPKMETPEKVSGVVSYLKNKTLWLCVGAIFLGGAAECTMAQWASGYLEGALGIDKVWGDIFGVAMFAAMLGLGRSLYAKLGKNAGNALFFGAMGAVVCYLAAAFTPFPLLGLIACGFCGFCVSMLWPGSLIIASDRFPAGGVFIFAMMASGGDLGASVGPQLVGVVTDAVIANPFFSDIALNLSLSPEQLGMKLGMLTAMLFPLFAIPLYVRIRKSKSSD